MGTPNKIIIKGAFFGVLIVVGFIFGSNQSDGKTIASKTAASSGDFFNSTPMLSPTVAFAVKEQCAEDAARLINTQQQIENKFWETAHQYHSGYTTLELRGSAFSSEMNTCVAEIDKSILQDNTSSNWQYIYDTTNSKILGEIQISVDGSPKGFIPTKPNGEGFNPKPDWATWADFERSIGL